MTELILNGKEIRTQEELHRYFARTLNFPEWYGGNLDALFDCLTDIREDVRITVTETELFKEHLNGYAEKVLRVLSDAAAENSHLKLLL